MPSLTEWKVPPAYQPRAGDYSFDLDRVLSSVVGLHSIIPPDAFSAETLGTERAGNGVVIDDGLVLTIGYLITEAETVWLHLGDGRVVEGHALGFDSVSGFGLVQALGRIDLDPLPFGSSAPQPKSATASVVGGAGGRTRSVASQIAAKQEFAGYWEYLLDEAIFTHPAHPNWGGTGLISNRGELIGIGSLQLERERDGKAEHVNMIVPIDLLKPVLDDLRKFGRVNKPARPWLGMYSTEIDNRVVVIGISAQGTRGARRTQGRRRHPGGEGRKDLKPDRLLPKALGARTRRRRRAAHRLPRGRHLRRGADLDRPRQAAQGAAAALNLAKERAMSEAVVDDIVAVLPPLLQSLEALGFIARHLNPPDFDSRHGSRRHAGPGVAGRAPAAGRLAASNSRHYGTALEAASDAALAAFAGLRAVQHGNGDLVAVFRALRHAPRAQEALYPLAAKLPPVSSFFLDPALRDDAGLLARLAEPAERKHRHHPRPQRARQPRRLLALRAGILHARSRLAAGDGAAWRQRQRPRLPVELAARRAQPRRDPGRADRDRLDTGR